MAGYMRVSVVLDRVLLRESSSYGLSRYREFTGRGSRTDEVTDWESLSQRRLIARIFALFKAYTWVRAWKATGDRNLNPCYMRRDDHNRKIWNRKQQVLVNIPS